MGLGVSMRGTGDAGQGMPRKLEGSDAGSHLRRFLHRDDAAKGFRQAVEDGLGDGKLVDWAETPHVDELVVIVFSVAADEVGVEVRVAIAKPEPAGGFDIDESGIGG